MRIAAISGSLRAQSSNGALLKALAALAPTSMRLSYFGGLGTLPHFNPDLDADGAEPPPAVASWRQFLRVADGFVFCSPEYAHGIVGSLKNALDWTVSSGEFVDKPVLVFNAAPIGGTFAQAALVETLRVMSARVLDDACLIEPFLEAKLPPDGRIAERNAITKLEHCLSLLAAEIP